MPRHVRVEHAVAEDAFQPQPRLQPALRIDRHQFGIRPRQPFAQGLPAFDLAIPGTEEVSGLAEDLAEQSNVVNKAPWSNDQITTGPIIAPGQGGRLTYPMGGIGGDDRPNLPARRLSVRQID